MCQCTKCNDNLKFLISLKSYEELAFALVPPFSLWLTENLHEQKHFFKT